MSTHCVLQIQESERTIKNVLAGTGAAFRGGVKLYIGIKGKKREVVFHSFSFSFSLSCVRHSTPLNFQSSTGHPGPSHAALCPVPLQASQGTLPRPLQAGHSLHPSSSEQNLSAPTVRAPLPRQNSQPQVPEPPQQSQGADGVFLCLNGYEWSGGGNGGGGGGGVKRKEKRVERTKLPFF